MLSSLVLLFWKPLLAVLGIAGAIGVSWLKGRQSAQAAQQRAAAQAMEARARTDDAIARQTAAQQVDELSKWERQG